jgi:hypothetical protein
MKSLRKHPLFLLAIALALPLGVAILYYDFYDGNDLVCHKQISIADNEDLLSFLRKNPRVLVSGDQPLPSAGIHPFMAKPVQSVSAVSTARTGSVLRC